MEGLRMTIAQEIFQTFIKELKDSNDNTVIIDICDWLLIKNNFTTYKEIKISDEQLQIQF
jgi:hypothetical protein